MSIENRVSYIRKNKDVFLIFTILFVIAFSIVIYQYSEWATSTERIKWKSFALLSGDEPMYLELTSTIIRHHSVYPDDFYKDPNPDPRLIFPDIYYQADSCRLHESLLGSNGHCYSGHQIGLSIVLVPGYWIGGVVGAMATMNLIFSLQGVLIFKLTSKFANRYVCFTAALLFSLGTILLSFSGRIYPELLTGFLLLLALYVFFQRENNVRNLLIVGALLGFLPSLKYTFLLFPVILLPIMTIILIKNKHKKNIIPLYGLFLVFLALYAWYGEISAPIEVSPGFSGAAIHYAKYIFGLSAADQITRGLANHLFGQSYGLFIFSPIALVSIFGIKLFWTKNKSMTITFILTFSLFVLLHSWVIPDAAGWTLPTRYTVPVLPLMVVPFVLLFERFSKKIIFHLPVIWSTYVGVSSNILFSRIIYGHSLSQVRADVSTQVYFGASKIFPYVNEDIEKYGPIHFWSNVSPFFWIFFGVLISLFCIFTFSHLIRENVKKLDRRQRYLALFITLFAISLVSVYVYNYIHEYVVESEITQIYNNDLGRDPDPAGMATWKNAMLNEGKSYQWVEDMIKNSPEGKVSEQVTKLYHDILGRDPDPAGMATWKNAMLNEGKSYQWVEDMIKNSPEALAQK